MLKKAAGQFNYLNFLPSGTVDRKSFLSDSESQPTSTQEWIL